MLNGLNPYSQHSPSRDTEVGFPRGARAASSSADSAEENNNVTSRVQSFPGQETTQPDGTPRDEMELSQEAQEIRELQLRDREVRAHEAAHAAAGGAYAGSPTYTFKRGADGHSYAVGGSVSIDISPVKGDPQATLQKAEQVRSAALAPAQPSAQDLKIAQKAQMMASEARIEMVQQNQPSGVSSEPISIDSSSETQKQPEANTQEGSKTDSSNISAGISRLDIYS